MSTIENVTTEAPALPTDTDLELAARILAEGQKRQDGWCRAEDIPRLRRVGGLPIEPEVDRWERLLQSLVSERPSVRVVVDGDEGYPFNLRVVAGRPALLFLDGSLAPEDASAVAVVGSRQASDEAVSLTTEIAGALAVRGYTIVSGLAKGIDTAAHKGALRAGGRTVAVVGTGIDEVFPPENGGFIDRVREAGVVVSQFPPGHGPTKTTFPARNAVIAGMSLGSVVVTASERSGTRIEIDRSLAQGRPVFLWRPLLGSQPWARDLARQDLVHLVVSVDEIDRLLQGTAG